MEGRERAGKTTDALYLADFEIDRNKATMMR